MVFSMLVLSETWMNFWLETKNNKTNNIQVVLL